MINEMLKFYLALAVIFVSYIYICDGRNVDSVYKRLACERLKRQVTSATTEGKRPELKNIIEKIPEVTEGSKVPTNHTVPHNETILKMTNISTTVLPVSATTLADDSGMEESDVIASALIEKRLSEAQEVTSISEFPYIVSILSKNNETQPLVLCTGILLNKTHVLATATCTATVPNVEDIAVRLGSLNSNEGGITRNVTKVIVHPEFKTEAATDLHSSIYNFAVLQLSADVLEENGIQYANITRSDIKSLGSKLDEVLERKSTCKAAGYGVTSLHKTNAGVLRYINTTLLNSSSCNAIQSDGVQNGKLICGSSQGENKGSCFYDDGGALSCNGTVYGMFVFSGIQMDCMMHPDLFVRLDSLTNFLFPNSINETKNQSRTSTQVPFGTTFIAIPKHHPGTKSHSIATVRYKEKNETGNATLTIKKKLVPFKIPEGKQQRRQPLCEQLRRPPPGVVKPTCIDSPPGCCPEECFEGIGRKRKWRHGNSASSINFDLVILPAVFAGMYNTLYYII